MPATSDPTMDFLRSLNDPTRYYCVPNVPIFKANRRVVKDKNGKVIKVVTVKPGDLRTIAQNTKQLEASGTVLPLTTGHRWPGMDEDKLAPIVGYARNAREGTFGPSQEPCILVDHYYDLDTWQDVKSQFPFRSAEYYDADKVITGVALLRRDPFLPLGMVAYGAGLQCLMYSLETPAMEENAVPDPNAIPGLTDPDELGDEDRQVAERYWKHYEKSQPYLAYAKQCYEAGPGGGGMSTPNAGNVAPPVLDKPEEAVRMQRDSEAIRYARIDQDNKQLQTRIAALERERDTEACERLVTQLQAEFYQLDRAEEVGEFLKLDKASRDKRMNYIRKHYKQDATMYSRQVDIHNGPVEASAPKNTMTREEQNEVARYAQRHGINDFEEALDKYRATKKPAA